MESSTEVKVLKRKIKEQDTVTYLSVYFGQNMHTNIYIFQMLYYKNEHETVRNEVRSRGIQRLWFSKSG